MTVNRPELSEGTQCDLLMRQQVLTCVLWVVYHASARDNGNERSSCFNTAGIFTVFLSLSFVCSTDSHEIANV